MGSSCLKRPKLSEDAFEMLARLLGGGTPKLWPQCETCNSRDVIEDPGLVPRVETIRGISVGEVLFSLKTLEELKRHGLVSQSGNLTSDARLLYGALAERMAAKAPGQLRELPETKPLVAAA